MKKLLISLLFLLLLTGCGAKAESEAPTVAGSDNITVPSDPAVPSSDPLHAPSIASSGSIQVYGLPCRDVYEISPMGSNLLLFSGLDRTTLTLLDSTMDVLAQTQLPCCVFPQEPAVRIGEKGVTYYDSGANAVVFLSPDLSENEQITLSDQNTGFPVVSEDRKYIYYATQDEIRVLDVQNGLDRLLRVTGNVFHRLVDLRADGSVLECSFADNGSITTSFISTQTGETLESVKEYIELYTGPNSFFLIRNDGSYPEKLAGPIGSEPRFLPGDRYDTASYPLPKQDAVIYTSAVDGCTVLDYYDLTTGILTYQLEIPEKYDISAITAGVSDTDVWMLCRDIETGEDMLCHWDARQNATGETQSRFLPRSTPEHPDLTGIAKCREKANALGAEYGVRILLWQDAVEFSSPAYTAMPEYQVPLIDLCLDQLQQVLPDFPLSFYSASSLSDSEAPLCICLVRSLEGDISQRALESAQGLFVWGEEGNGYLFLTAGSDLAPTFYHEMSHVIDSCVLSRCDAYDNWDSLNPQGFEYDYDFISNLCRTETYPAMGNRRYFVDTYSMSYPTEDRARILEFAMQSDCDFFSSPFLQKKLRQMCIGIRQAYELTENDLPVLWEQHLQTPLE